MLAKAASIGLNLPLAKLKLVMVNMAKPRRFLEDVPTAITTAEIDVKYSGVEFT